MAKKVSYRAVPIERLTSGARGDAARREQVDRRDRRSEADEHHLRWLESDSHVPR
jgi:hypothetical protein